MGNRRTLIAAAAIVLAAAAGLGVYFYASGADKRAEDRREARRGLRRRRRHPEGDDRATLRLAEGLITRREGPARVGASVGRHRLEPRSSGKVAAATISGRSSSSRTSSFVAPSEGGGGYARGVDRRRATRSR